MAFFGGQNPSMMNSTIYQQMLAMMQGGGGGMPSMQNMAPQIGQQHQPGSNISQIPQQPRQPQGPAGGAVGGAVQAGNNVQSLYGMGKGGYNGLFGQNGLFGSGQPAGANPNAMQGSPVANNPAGDAYLAQNPNMAQGGGALAQNGANATAGLPPAQPPQPFFSGMQGYGGASGAPQSATGAQGMMPNFSANSQISQMPGGQNMAQGTMANFMPPAPTANMFGSMGANGMNAASTGAGAAGTAAAADVGTTGAATDASASNWLQQLWDAL